MTPREDAAQVVLGALLAWPLLGLTAGLLALERWSDRSAGIVLFGAGAGLGAGLAYAGAELARQAARRRWPARRARPWAAAFALLALVAPAATLLAGDFATRLQATGSSSLATEQLVSHHDAWRLVDADAALSCVLVAGALLVGRARGWRRASQAAVGSWLVLAAIAARLVAGRLEALPLATVLLVEVGLAALGPYLLAAADQAVRAARDLLAGATRERWARLRAALLRATGPAAVVGARWLALDAGEGARSVLAWGSPHLLLALGVATPLVVARARGASLRTVVGLTLATSLLAAAALGAQEAALVAGSAAAALALPAALTRLVAAARPRHAAPVGLALALALTTCVTGALPPARNSASVRAEVGTWLGLDPVPLYRRARGANARLFGPGRESAWSRVLSDLGLSPGRRGPLDLVLKAAAAGGDPLAAVDLLDPPADLSAAELDDAAVLLLRKAHTLDDETVRFALAEVWLRCPGRRGELEALLVRDPDRWIGTVASVLSQYRTARPGRRLLSALAARERHRPRTTRRLFDAVQLEPGFARLEHLELLDELRAGPFGRRPPPLAGWARLLAAADLRPLDADGFDAQADGGLSAAGQRAWREAWDASGAALDADPEDPVGLRARAHALLAVARGQLRSEPAARAGSEFALEFAELCVRRAGSERRAVPPTTRPWSAAAAFDEALVRLHQALARVTGGAAPDTADLHALLDLVESVAPDVGVAERLHRLARVAALRALVVAALGPPDPARIASARAVRVRALLALSWEICLGPEEAHRLRAVAAALLRAP